MSALDLCYCTVLSATSILGTDPLSSAILGTVQVLPEKNRARLPGNTLSTTHQKGQSKLICFLSDTYCHIVKVFQTILWWEILVHIRGDGFNYRVSMGPKKKYKTTERDKHAASPRHASVQSV